MRILAHRGLWSAPEEKNTLTSFSRAFENGFGIETDVRDYCGKLVVSHDIATEQSEPFAKVLDIYNQFNSNEILAVNIKADGIQNLLSRDLQNYSIDNYFVFDMSIPEQVVYHKQNFNVYTRMSEYETHPVLEEKSEGIWMDEWEKSWIAASIIEKYLLSNKKVSVISPEIHGRDKTHIWKQLKQFKDNENVLLCTDVPLEAKEYFV
ncbi:MAG: hypothetical protein IJR29_05495 [Butyrivibrio sp.]|nr:hypothetical protein [Butyrivibrio sp.]